MQTWIADQNVQFYIEVPPMPKKRKRESPPGDLRHVKRVKPGYAWIHEDVLATEAPGLSGDVSLDNLTSQPRQRKQRISLPVSKPRKQRAISIASSDTPVVLQEMAPGPLYIRSSRSPATTELGKARSQDRNVSITSNNPPSIDVPSTPSSEDGLIENQLRPVTVDSSSGIWESAFERPASSSAPVQLITAPLPQCTPSFEPYYAPAPVPATNSAFEEAMEHAAGSMLMSSETLQDLLST